MSEHSIGGNLRTHPHLYAGLIPRKEIGLFFFFFFFLKFQVNPQLFFMRQVCVCGIAHLGLFSVVSHRKFLIFPWSITPMYHVNA